MPKLDAVVDCAGGDTIKEGGLKKLQAAEKAAAEHRHPTAAKLTYIWSSGTWVQGNSAFERRSDGAAITSAPSLTSWRTEIEQPLIKSSVLNGIVIRPSLVYGRGGSITRMFFQQAAENKAISWPGSRGGRLATIHTDDLAECYRLAVEKAPIAKGNVFDCSNPGQESTDLVLYNLALLVGFSPDKITYKAPSNLFEEAVITSSPLQPVLARSLLGWQALKPSLTDGLPQYYRSYLAHAGKSQQQ